MQNPSFFARKGVFARETFAGFLPLFYKSRRRRAICSANRKCSKKKHHPSGWCFFLLCVDKKDATFPVVRKERDVCRGNLSRVNTVAALRFAAIQTPQIAPLPRNGFASSAAGGASPVSPCFLIPPQDKFAKQTCPLQKRNTTQWVVFLFCLVLTEKMRSGKCTTVQSVESSIPQLTI